MAKAALTTVCTDREVLERVERMRARYHSELDDFEATINVLWIDRRTDEDGEWVDGPLLTHNGYSALATIRKTPERDRLLGVADAILSINGEFYRDLDDAGRDALIDHELEHLEIARRNNDEVLWDDAGRPKLRLRKHDWQLGGFLSIARIAHMETAGAPLARLTCRHNTGC